MGAPQKHRLGNAEEVLVVSKGWGQSRETIAPTWMERIRPYSK